jgi:hypothetical protein
MGTWTLADQEAQRVKDDALIASLRGLSETPVPAARVRKAPVAPAATESDPPVEYKFHPLANELPMMVGLEFDELKSSIKSEGLKRSIIRQGVFIIDGRNRYKACIELALLTGSRPPVS